MSTLNVDGLVDKVRELATLARAAQGKWKPAYTVYDEGEPPEPTPPDDERQVLVFLNGHVDIHDSEGRAGGGWGVRLSWYDDDKRRWLDRDVTHWMDLPGAPDRPEGGAA